MVTPPRNLSRQAPAVTRSPVSASAVESAAEATDRPAVSNTPLAQPSRIGLMRGRPLRAGVVLLVAYAVLSRAFIAVVVPPWQGPDEPKHFEYARLLVDKWPQLLTERRLFTLDDASPPLQTQVILSMARHHFWEFLGRPAPAKLPNTFLEAFGTTPSQLNRPSLYYPLAALSMLPVKDGSLEDQLLAMRLLSAVLGGLAVLPAYALLRLIATNDPCVPLAGAALVAGLPMSVFIGGVTNNDNLLLVVGMCAALGMVSGVLRGFSGRTWLVILGTVVLGLLTKRGAVILLPGVAACALVWFVRLRRPLRLVILLLVVGAAGGVVLGARSGALVRVLPLERAQAALIAYALNGLYQWQDLLRVPLSAPQTNDIVSAEVDAYFKSFWGLFGWFSVPLNASVYAALRGLTRVCVVGCLVWCSGLVGPRFASAGARLTLAGVLALLVSSGIVAGLAERLAYYSPAQVPQGRYLFVVLGPIAALYALGLRAWLPRRFFGTALPTAAALVGLVALDVYAYVSAIQPYFDRFSE